MEFPLLKQINMAREECFNESYKAPDFKARAAYWVGHKILTVISIPTNLFATGFCTFTCAASACTLGAFKIVIFAASLGNIKLTYPTGCYWLAGEACEAITAIFKNTFELLQDAGSLLENGYNVVRWVGKQLHLDGLFKAILTRISQIFEFCIKRLDKGVKITAKREPEIKWDQASFPVQEINTLTEKYRIDFSSKKRSFESIFSHYVFSVITTPLNALIALCSGIACAVLSSGFVAKVIIFSATNLDIPIPTYAANVFKTCVESTTNLLKDVGVDLADIFVTVYKISDTLRLNRVVASILDVVHFIPEAIFGK